MSKKKERSIKVNLSYQINGDIVTFFWSDSGKYQMMDLVKFQNYGLMKKAPWIWSNSSVEDNNNFHKRFKERLDEFYRLTG